MRVIPDAPNHLVRPFLERDRIWNCFALADLEPPYRAHSRFPVAVRADGSVAAAVLIFEAGGIRSVFPSGDQAGIAAVLRSVDLPGRAMLFALADDMPVLGEAFDLDGTPEPKSRMVVDRAGLVRVPPADGAPVVELGPQYLDEIDALFAGWVGNPVAASHFADGVMRGVRDDRGQLAAIAAAHVVSPSVGIGVIGGVFTGETERGRGYAKATTSAVASALLELGCDMVLLNVVAGNAAARRAYKAIGFTERLTYLRARGERRAG